MTRVLTLKPVPIPIGYQHTMCVIGVSLARAAMEVLGPAVSYSAPNRKLVERIERWIDACEPYCKEHKLSQGAKRDLDKMFTTIGAQVDAARGDDEKRLAVWSAVLYAANLFISDAYRFAKDISKGAACWRWLDKTTNTFVQHMKKICPKLEDEGWAFYFDLQVDVSQFRKRDAEGRIIYELVGDE